MTLLTSRRSVGVDAALDFREALLVANNHRGDGDRSSYEDRDDRYQERAQTRNRVDQSHATSLPQGPKPPAFSGALTARLKPRPFKSPDQHSGGADRDRTGGLLVANQALSQLSYSPTASFKVSRFKVSMTLKP